jgi:lipopolysaccharide transport system ATP-binding protein
MTNTNIAIALDSISKKYVIGSYKNSSYVSFREELTNGLISVAKRFLGNRKKPKTKDFWALKDVSFEVNEGDVIGVIGKNGSGKSTLLKILSRITQPTNGNAKIYGRVASLLEVGTGFHPELTGRENIFLNAAILGMKKSEVLEKLNSIIEFSGVQEFLDTPVKRYSSGMYVRLAFSVASHLNPEILLVDEVLAVGDAEFQSRCLNRMNDISNSGRTIFFVSHNMTAVNKLCNKAIWLNSGRLIKYGDTKSVVTNYLSNIKRNLLYQEWPDKDTAPGNAAVKIEKVYVKGERDDLYEDEQLAMDLDFIVGIEYYVLIGNKNITISFQLLTVDGIIAFQSSTSHDLKYRNLKLDTGRYFAKCRIPKNLLNSNTYTITFRVVENQTNVLYRLDDALTFDLLDSVKRRGAYLGKRKGIFSPILEWESGRITT